MIEQLREATAHLPDLPALSCHPQPAHSITFVPTLHITGTKLIRRTTP